MSDVDARADLAVNLVLFHRDNGSDDNGSADNGSASNARDVTLIDTVRVLMIRRLDEPFAGRWAMPGGGLNPGERFSDAALRHARTVTGMQMATIDLDHVDVYDEPDRDPRGRAIAVGYSGFLADMPLAEVSSGVAAAAWIRLTAALGLDREEMAFDHHEMLIDAAYARRIIPG